METVKIILLILIMMVFSIEDIFTKKIIGGHLLACIPAIAFCVWINISYGQITIPGMLIGLIPGVLMLAAAGITGQIGTGDAVICMMMGMIIGIKGLLAALLSSMFFLDTVVMVGMVMGKVNRKTVMPFIPFLSAGSVVAVLLFR